MNGRVWRFVVVLMCLVLTAGVVGKNRALKQLLSECRDGDAHHVDLIFDLQQENADLLDRIIELENEDYEK